MISNSKAINRSVSYWRRIQVSQAMEEYKEYEESTRLWVMDDLHIMGGVSPRVANFRVYSANVRIGHYTGKSISRQCGTSAIPGDKLKDRFVSTTLFSKKR
ncbi:hypothetical protein LIER_05225 [Lithospermum erythrorhizon]|uniref:Uncharacterized protein n=1 Tax=Lithospermum erythrorhizon TaxID=34254 RepID=A0AAV3P0C8_LITER